MHIVVGLNSSVMEADSRTGSCGVSAHEVTIRVLSHFMHKKIIVIMIDQRRVIAFVPLAMLVWRIRMSTISNGVGMRW
jgi:hypothetical protein